jgi:hypothetical protein
MQAPKHLNKKKKKRRTKNKRKKRKTEQDSPKRTRKIMFKVPRQNYKRLTKDHTP